MNRITALTVAVILALLFTGPLALAGTGTAYTFVTIGYPGTAGAIPYAINNKGQVAWSSDVQNGAQWRWHGFVMSSKGLFTAVVYPHSFDTWVYGINDQGQAAGYCSYYQGGVWAYPGFVYQGGHYTRFDVPGAAPNNFCGVAGSGINDNGEVAGWYCTTNSEYFHGFIRSADGTTFTPVDNPQGDPSNGGYGTALYQINNNDDVTGSYFTSSGKHGFARIATAYHDISFPNSPDTEIWGINNKDQIAGYYYDENNFTHGFVYEHSDGSYTTIDYPYALSTQVYGINDSGQVTGVCQDIIGGHYFIATPATGTEPYTISGTITDAHGSALEGIIMTLSGPMAQATQTDTGGNYSFPELANGTYTVKASITPAKNHKASLVVKVNGSDPPSQNFTGTPLYWIGGIVSLAPAGGTLPGVTIEVTGVKNVSVKTDAYGEFRITGLPEGNYTIKPVKTGYTFNAITLHPLNQNMLSMTIPATKKK